MRSWRRNTQHHGTPFNQSAPQMAGHTPSMEVIEVGPWEHIMAHACHHAPHHEPLTQRHFLHHTTHIHNSRRFAFPRSASIIALNTASENVQHNNLDVSNEWATPTARAPSTTKCAPPCPASQLDPIPWHILQSLKMGVVAHAFNKRRCILDVDFIQSCNELPKYNFTNCKAINEASLSRRRRHASA